MNTSTSASPEVVPAAASSTAPGGEPQPGSPQPGSPQSRRASGVEVARRAGVSQKTVSRVVNGEPNVSDDVRRRVLRAAEELGYRPNSAARALLTGRSRRLGVVWLGSALYGPSHMLVTLEHAARAQGYSLSLSASGPAGQTQAAVDALLAQGVDGIVIDEPVDDHPLLTGSSPVPVMSLGWSRADADASIEVAGQDWRPPITEAVQHLLQLGHSTVHHISGPLTWWTARDRRDAWREALLAAQRPCPPSLPGDWSAASGYRAARHLLEDSSVSAIFCANDEMAIGAIRAAVEAGLQVPKDVSVIGLDDIPAAEFLNPPLSTIRQEFEAVVDVAIARLVDRIEGRAVPTATPFPIVPAFISRGTTAAPPAHR
ncbi:LacI family DNA-binding transcriptional regulator [Kineococcus sp. SYSU DK006]|uniref:LacI family DNA-binding transcriptional regulator n=1 Tax=Kineococcus sp. SYSU DK006 TaxID=3383127 RepID=UPI003D7E00E1